LPTRPEQLPSFWPFLSRNLLLRLNVRFFAGRPARRILVNGLQLRQVAVGDSSNVPSPVRSRSRTDPKKALARKALRKAGLEGKRGFLLEGRGSEGLSPFLFLADNPRVAVSFSGASASSLEPRSAKRKGEVFTLGLAFALASQRRNTRETRLRVGLWREDKRPDCI
jgi:hypothetical protein